jgi:hypothetical protein
VIIKDLTLVAGYVDPDKEVTDFKPDPLFALKRTERRNWH